MTTEKREIPPWHEYFLNMIGSIKARSADRSTQVGVVIVGEGNAILSTGYNSFPRGVDTDIDSRHERPIKYSYTEHAERNAIYNAAREGTKLLGSTIYMEMWPCEDCTRGIIQAGISRIVVDGRGYRDKMKYWVERWEEDMIISHDMLSDPEVKRNIGLYVYLKYRERGKPQYRLTNIDENTWRELNPHDQEALDNQLS